MSVADCQYCGEPHEDLRVLATTLGRARSATVNRTTDRATFFDADGQSIATNVSKWHMFVAMECNGDEAFAAMLMDGGLV